ncbi:hypothetical protein P43SY_001691 [Pythium insidiosum]|uniref:Nuclear speckle splicing regulatory protein 1 N-terminal domain-containing protein n=1 Tax=Pythium insidiosum TaxID=114742 RepID=A0AAD5QAA4_PYTIN|nr:hypothetical protein P43SY_001691 [Pythium insidiosum]
MAFSMKLPAKKTAPRESAAGKQYGLILPTKADAKKSRPSAFNVFGNPDANDGSDASSALGRENARQRVGLDAARSVNQTLVAQTHKKALEEDPSVFDYDGVYDEIQSSRQDKASKRKAEREAEKKQSKYITSLVEKAKIREIEHERIRERRLLKERATEDALYGDKEKLISASYKRKLMEMKRWDEEDARLDAVEAAEEVTKRGTEAMAGFYANLLTKNIAMGSDVSSSRSAYTAKPSKDEVISAAKARYLARKAMRSTVPTPNGETK